MTSRLLEFIDLQYKYPGGREPVLSGLSLWIPEGKKCVLLGRNGCGKSTLFLHGNGIIEPQQGQVLWKGKPLVYKRAALQEMTQKVGLVFQDPEHQLIASTVAEDISYGLFNQKLPVDVIREKVERVLDAFGLRELAEAPIHHLSLGQKRRLALAGVMVMEPELLLLDEPTAYLDRYQTKNLLRELDAIHRQGTTVLMATHDMDIAFEWAEWICIMDKGRLVFAGDPQEALENRAMLESLHLGMPLLVDVWEALPEQWKRELGGNIPRSVDELRKMLSVQRVW
ncbi:ABC transporter ATP-binding protein [Brevibacillus formosus]|uniref:Cobalt ABC transporter ATP-binding protein n=1 Tax=Brevibacillus formosus TaxID=54913 RepID=A0A837KGN6_9BACL|nr:ABC transporter ATP-binding protein [Brevibacillus formosus]KLH96910.1 cobalt ABC transporter ATP-binding protein [Brevibacillus formosus]MED1955340.1 ABC transporter ATP-binding protein [Brevibacillus formosus]PSJ97021.1 ABC transporter ATP-binding protein [Brevibacillus formosus]GED58585.1 energy-coupling factor ABC transporter ATP-binding protein [Brevibacillus formosus]